MKQRIDPNYIEFAEVDDIWVRAYSVAKANTVMSQHIHTHDHITLVSSGSIEAWQDGESIGVFTAPSIVKIPAGKKHAFLALTDNVVVCCLHTLRGTDLAQPEIKEAQSWQ
jgi:quercetin dioxygenase-like cupin family protein